jgi:3-isopropylmalate/(R)-2-methylmalate dehydratase large subunit
MAMTITEKILARAAGKTQVVPGDNIWVKVDILLTHDICGPGTIGVFQQEFGKTAKVWDPDKVAIIPDHYIFTCDSKAHRNIDTLRQFVQEQGIRHFYDPADSTYRGVCHVALPEIGLVRPGTVIFGTDSHTCTHGALGAFATGIGNTDAGFILGTGKLLIKVPKTLRFRVDGPLPPRVMAKDIILRIIGDIGFDGASYCAMEFTGDTIAALSIEERMTICNMAIEAGGKNGIIAPDEKAFDYIRTRTSAPLDPIYGDPDAAIEREWRYDAATLVPCVAEPHVPSNYAAARDRQNINLKNHKVAVPTFLVPATVEVAEALITQSIGGRSLVQIFADAGCEEIAPPSCAACLGGPEDTYGRTSGSEAVISTTNRNFIGRMGSKNSRIWLASPLTVAASAVTGHITDPRDIS